MPAAGAGRGDEVDRLTGLWSALTAFTKSPGAWKLDPKRRAALAARVKEYDEATVLRVARWVNESSHDRARFLKERGDVKTLIRPENFATYAALSDGWTPGTAASTGSRSEVPTDEAARAWEWVCALVRQTGQGATPPEPTNAWEARARTALRQVQGGWGRVKNIDDFKRRALREEFVARWNEIPNAEPASAPTSHIPAPANPSPAPRAQIALLPPVQRAQSASGPSVGEPPTRIYRMETR